MKQDLPGRLRRFLFIFLQCTWGLPQTLVGLTVFLICRLRKCRSFPVGGAVCTEWKRADGISLGLFFFCPPWGGLHLHEYGHTHQSLLFGPLYLLFVSLPSLLWAGLPVFTKYRSRRGVPYSRLYCEGWADRIASKYRFSRANRSLERLPKKEKTSPPPKEEENTPPLRGQDSAGGPGL